MPTIKAKASVSRVRKRFMTGPEIVTMCCLYVHTAGSNTGIQPYKFLGGRYLLSNITALNLALYEAFNVISQKFNTKHFSGFSLPQHGPPANSGLPTV
jgi:hypothetical protein